jgi:hypothetical protein
MRARLLFIGVAASLAIGGCDAPPAAPGIENSTLATPQPVLPEGMDKLTRQRIRDLVDINHALLIYQSGHAGRFPRSTGFDGYASDAGASLGPRWIPQLADRYMSPLPRDPAGAETAATQYLYWSDGRDFKLIAQGSGDCSTAVEAGGVRRDPKRSDAAGCSAYGFWTPGAEDK